MGVGVRPGSAPERLQSVASQSGLVGLRVLLGDPLVRIPRARHVLPPLGQKAVMAIDPGFRTGCKVVLLDRQGKLLHNDAVYPDRHAVEASEKDAELANFGLSPTLHLRLRCP